MTFPYFQIKEEVIKIMDEMPDWLNTSWCSGCNSPNWHDPTIQNCNYCMKCGKKLSKEKD